MSTCNTRQARFRYHLTVLALVGVNLPHLILPNLIRFWPHHDGLFLTKMISSERGARGSTACVAVKWLLSSSAFTYTSARRTMFHMPMCENVVEAGTG
ncbi:hypothetical protein V8F06_012716 [Rhypophila decipiens]